jgi:hypothetical protein
MKVLEFSRSVPQPPSLPDHITDAEIRGLWRTLVHALLDAGVELHAMDDFKIEGLCTALALLRQCRDEDAAVSNEAAPAAYRELECDTRQAACAFARSLKLPHDVLEEFLTPLQ